MTNTLTVTEKEQYEYLKDLHSMLCEEINDLQESHKRQQRELDYLRSFVRYKKLDQEYNHFMENAYYLESEQFPFGYFVL